MGLLSAGAKLLAGMLGQQAGGPLPITYTQRSTGQSAQITGAWPGSSPFQRQGTDGQLITISERYYMIPVALLVVGGVPIVPADGDTIADPNSPDPVTGSTPVFQAKVTTGEPVSRYMDHVTRTVWRVHTKRLS